VDEDFRANYDISAELTEKQIIELCGQYATDCLDDKKFVFGKYTVSNDGIVWISIFSSTIQQFHLLCRLERHFHTKAKLFYKCSHIFSSIPRTRTLMEIVHCPSLPEPQYPKTALAIAIAAVCTFLVTYLSNG
jgi:hypothetical protein